jgi:hypothetical protein
MKHGNHLRDPLIIGIDSAREMPKWNIIAGLYFLILFDALCNGKRCQRYVFCVLQNIIMST